MKRIAATIALVACGQQRAEGRETPAGYNG